MTEEKKNKNTLLFSLWFLVSMEHTAPHIQSHFKSHNAFCSELMWVQRILIFAWTSGRWKSRWNSTQLVLLSFPGLDLEVWPGFLKRLPSNCSVYYNSLLCRKTFFQQTTSVSFYPLQWHKENEVFMMDLPSFVKKIINYTNLSLLFLHWNPVNSNCLVQAQM